MIDRQYGQLRVICDNCGEVAELDPQSSLPPYSPLSLRLAEGWDFYKENDEWCDICPTCDGGTNEE